MKNYFGLIAVLVCGFAHGADQVPADKLVTGLSVYDGVTYVSFSPSFPFTQGCPNGGDVVVTIDTSNDKGREMYAAVLTAASSKRPIGFGASGCLSDRPMVYRVDVSF